MNTEISGRIKDIAARKGWSDDVLLAALLEWFDDRADSGVWPAQGEMEIAGWLADKSGPETAYFSSDRQPQPVVVGAHFWSNDLRVVQVTGVATHANAYADTGCTQTWHRTTEVPGDDRGSDFDTLDGDMQPYGRLARYFEGLDAEDYPPGTRFADARASRSRRS